MKKILSITDVITNSSTEVFAYKKDSEYFKELCEYLEPELLGQFETYNTLEEIWEAINDPGYCGIMNTEYEQARHGDADWEGLDMDPFGYSDWNLRENMEKLIESGHRTKREVFDFFSPFYKKALGIAFHSVGEGDSRDELAERLCEFEEMKYKEEQERKWENLKKEMSSVKAGEFLAMGTKLREWKKPIIIESGGGTEVNAVYMPEAVPEYKYMDDTKEHFEDAISFIDPFSHRPATESEIQEFMEAKKNDKGI